MEVTTTHNIHSRFVTTTSRRFLLAYTGFQYASESATRLRCLCGSVYTMQPLATWLTSVCRPTPCVVASNCVPRRLGLCWSRVPGLLLVSAASPSIDHEHGTVCHLSLEHQIRLCAPSSIISRPICFSSSLHCCWWWLSTVRPAPLWLFSEFGAVYKYSDLLTYLLTYEVAL